VNVKINNEQETLCEVVEGGFYTGLNHCKVVIKGDSTNTKRYFPNEMVKPFLREEF
jgi:hypothetical protein